MTDEYYFLDRPIVLYIKYENGNQRDAIVNGGGQE